MEWISVKDRLPGSDQCQVVVIKYNEEDKHYMIEEAWWLPCPNGWTFTIGFDCKMTWVPDYWFPLPKLPKLPEKGL
jgi:hypothetical protein